MKVAILSCILGSFDVPVNPVEQNISVAFHRFTDWDFPPITGLTPRLQYRMPKLFGWEMYPGFEYYIWLDGSVSLIRPDSAQWLLDQLGDNDMAVFKHPWRSSIREEADHIEEYLQKGNEYITTRYKNGLHKEQLALIQGDKSYTDNHLYASTAFVYRNTPKVKEVLDYWWFLQSRYYTCDQLAFTYALSTLNVSVIQDSPFKSEYIKLVSEHH